MAIMKEWACKAHGEFDSTEAKCPHGCHGTVIRVFLTAPGINTGMVGRVDKTLGKFAKDYGLGDVSNRNGSVANSVNVQSADRFRRRPEEYDVESGFRDKEHKKRADPTPYWLDLGDHEAHKERQVNSFVPQAENRLFEVAPGAKEGESVGTPKLPQPKVITEYKPVPLET